METKHNHYKVVQIEIAHGRNSKLGDPLIQYRNTLNYCFKCKIEFTQIHKIGTWKLEHLRSDNPCGQASGDLQYLPKAILISESDIIPKLMVALEYDNTSFGEPFTPERTKFYSNFEVDGDFVLAPGLGRIRIRSIKEKIKS